MSVQVAEQPRIRVKREERISQLNKLAESIRDQSDVSFYDVQMLRSHGIGSAWYSLEPAVRALSQEDLQELAKLSPDYLWARKNPERMIEVVVHLVADPLEKLLCNMCRVSLPA
jgi:hypothetical protein